MHVIGDLLSSLAALIAGAVIYCDRVASHRSDTVARDRRPDPRHDARAAARHAARAHGRRAGGGRSRRDRRARSRGVRGVVAVHDLHVWSIAPGSVALSAHLEIGQPRLAGDTCEGGGMLRDRFGIDHVTLQPERRQREPHRGHPVVAGEDRGRR